MKNKIQLAAVGASASVLMLSAMAQVTPDTKTDRRDNTHDRMHQVQRADRLNDAAKTSDVIGMTVKNYQDEKLGKVEDILVDLPSGRVVALIVSSGGFLGLGDELSAVPPTAFRFTPERDTLQLDASKELLSNAPHFKANQWPDFGQPSYASGVYQAYRVQPYFSTNTTTALDNSVGHGRAGKDGTLARTEPDNTARNVRDRSNNSVTPFDQGSDKTDVATTAQIRREIIANKSMSVNARNVKIITNKGQVTLRGPVSTAEEKRLIGDIAVRVARLENVDNQLEVK